METPRHIKQLAVHLPALDEVWQILCKAGLHAEAAICTGLRDLVAKEVISEAVHGSAEYEAARVILHPTNEELANL